MNQYSLLFKIITTVSLILFTVSSCNNEFLEPPNENELSPDTFWQSADDARKAIVGAYSPLSTVFGWGRMMILHTVYRSDVVDPYANQGVITDASNFSVNPNFARLNEIWGEFWKTIFRTNLILENVPTIKDANLSQEERNGILGEAHFLRAFQYFYLITMFRNVPLLTQPPVGLEEITAAPADPAAVWELIIADLQQAQSLLPAQWEGATRVGPLPERLPPCWVRRIFTGRVSRTTQAISPWRLLSSKRSLTEGATPWYLTTPTISMRPVKITKNPFLRFS